MTLEIRKKLSYAYQILSYLKLDDLTYTHLSARSDRGFYIYPFGLLFNEVTKDNLIEITLEGQVINNQDAKYNKTGYVIHGKIYKQRKDINAIFHIHTPEIVAVSACADGLMPISQWALHFYNKISYYDYNSLALTDDDGNDISQKLGSNYVMLMRNHGSITAGCSIEEAMFYTYHLQQACKTQCLALYMNSNLLMPNDEICKLSNSDLLSFEQRLGKRDFDAWVRLIDKQKMK